MATPSELTFLRTIRDTDDPIAQNKPLEIGSKTWMMNPDQTQALGWMMGNGKTATPVYNHIFGHNEDGPFANWVQYTGSDETSSQAVDNLTIDNVLERCATGQILMNVRTKELIRLNANPDAADTTQGVTRNAGRGVATDYLLNGDRLLLLTPQMAEGFTMGKPQSGVSVYSSFSTGLVSYPVAATSTENNEKRYDGLTPFEVDLFKSWDRFNANLEAAMFFSSQVLDSSTYTQNYHTMSGIYDFIDTNVFDVSNTYLSRLDLLDILLQSSRYWKGDMAIICSRYMKAHISELGYSKFVSDQDSKVLGMNIEKINLGGKLYPLIEADFLGDDEELNGTFFICPKGHSQYHWLQENRSDDIAYNPVNRDEIHSDEGEISGEIGFEYWAEEDWGLVTGYQF